MINWIHSLKGEYIIAKGHIQSGKTNFTICVSNLLIYMGFNVAIILRNNKADREQFKDNFSEFQFEHNSIYNQRPLLVSSVSKNLSLAIAFPSGKNLSLAIAFPSGKKSVNMPQIFLSLGNVTNMKKTFIGLSSSSRPYVVIIDEVDSIDSGGDSKKSKILYDMKKGSYCVFGVSGTVMDPIAKEKVQTKNIITLKTPSDYKGVFNNKIQLQSKVTEDFEFDEEKNKYSGLTDDNLFKNVELESFIRHYLTMSPFNFVTKYHPRVCLVNIAKCIEPYMKAQKKICEMFPGVITIVYNGEGITVKRGDSLSIRKTTISEVLQDIKDTFSDVKHIIIFAGELAGRGISFKSKDRLWHLTDEFLIVAKKSDEPELMQKVRLCGRYQDDILLTLFTTKKIISDLRCACYRQEECVFESKKEDNKDKICKDVLTQMVFSKSKMTNRSLFKDKCVSLKLKVVNGQDDGLSSSVYEGGELLPNSFYDLYKTNRPSQEDRHKYQEDQDDDDDEEEDDEDGSRKKV
jgi:hypothetical protein